MLRSASSPLSASLPEREKIVPEREPVSLGRIMSLIIYFFSCDEYVYFARACSVEILALSMKKGFREEGRERDASRVAS